MKCIDFNQISVFLYNLGFYFLLYTLYKELKLIFFLNYDFLFFSLCFYVCYLKKSWTLLNKMSNQFLLHVFFEYGHSLELIIASAKFLFSSLHECMNNNIIKLLSLFFSLTSDYHHDPHRHQQDRHSAIISTLLALHKSEGMKMTVKLAPCWYGKNYDTNPTKKEYNSQYTFNILILLTFPTNRNR